MVFAVVLPNFLLIISPTALASSISTMPYRSSIESVLWPIIFLRKGREMPSFRMLRLAERRLSCGMNPFTPARSQAAWQRS